jgi:tripartite-type tricarboxylate transporter receptor subunit TctC
MHRCKNLFSKGLLAAFVALAGIAPAGAQTAAYPAKSITLVVPFPAGGTTDVLGRHFAKAFSEQLGQPVVIANRSGASGSIGAAFVASAPADGYTLLFGTSNEITMSPHLYRTLPYDPVKSFTPIGGAADIPNVLVLYPGLGINDMSTFLKKVRAAPQDMVFAESGLGSINHLTEEMFAKLVGFPLSHVSYRGGAPAMADVAAGHVPALFATLPAALGMIAAGKLKALAVTSEKRAASLPDVPTLGETEAGHMTSSFWNGVLAPAGLPKDIAAVLINATAKAVATPAFKQALKENGADPLPYIGAEYGKFIESDLKKWGEVVNGLSIPKQ